MTSELVTMDSTLFLKANDLYISLEKGLEYLQLSGKLDSVIWEIMKQHILEQELQRVAEIGLNDDIIDEILINFRAENQLIEPSDFQEWLESEGMDEMGFRKQLVDEIKFDRLKQQVTQTNLEEYFIERKLFLDQVILTRLVVEDKVLAEELLAQVVEDGVSFEQLIRDYSVAEDAIFNGMMGAISWGSLPDELRTRIDGINPGDLSEPVEIDGLWYIVRVEKFLSASLDEQTQQELEDELFEEWLEGKIQEIDVELLVDF